MKGPYENNKVYAVASHPTKGLKAGFVSAVYAQVKYNYSGLVSDDPSDGRFFLVDPDDYKDAGGNADCWDPGVAPGSLLALPEDDEPVNPPDTHVLSTWSDRERAWAEFEARRAAGRKGAKTRADRVAEEQAAKLAEERKAREESPLGRIKKAARTLEHAFVVPERYDNPSYVMVQMRMTPDGFRRMMTKRGVDADLVEEFLADDNDFI